jgi:hypothetical protein
MCNDCMHLKMKYNIYDQCENIQVKDPINQNKLNQEVLLFEKTEKKVIVCFLH